MIKTWLRLGGMAVLAAAAFGLGRAADAGTVKVYANNEVTGDNFHGGAPFWGIFESPLNQGVINSGNPTGWSYANVQRTDTVIGVNGNLQHDGNGSVYLELGANSKSKADISYNPGGVLGLLSELTSLSYDWIRTGGTASAHYAPAIRVKVSAGAKSGYLVWEPIYNGAPTAPLNDWTTSDAIGGKFWATDALYSGGMDIYQSLGAWVTALGSNATITEINVGIGSGWNGTFTGATDNITFGFNGQSTTYNFEVSPAAVPEPGSIALGLIAGGLGLAGAAWRRRRVG